MSQEIKTGEASALKRDATALNRELMQEFNTMHRWFVEHLSAFYKHLRERLTVIAGITYQQVASAWSWDKRISFLLASDSPEATDLARVYQALRGINTRLWGTFVSTHQKQFDMIDCLWLASSHIDELYHQQESRLDDRRVAECPDCNARAVYQQALYDFEDGIIDTEPIEPNVPDLEVICHEEFSCPTCGNIICIPDM